MNRIFLILFLLLTGETFSQKTYVTSMAFTFSGGNNMGTAIGNDCGHKDIDIQYNSIDGNMEVTVNKACHTWSYVQHWMGGPYAPSIVFKNRFIEMRILSSASQDSGLSIGFQTSGGNPDGAMGKSIPALNYQIHDADTWETKFFHVGGTADTVFKEVDYLFPDGFYKLDYVFYGDAARPPVPTIFQVKDQVVAGWYNELRSLTLEGIAIPGRNYEGLVLEAKTKNEGFIKDVYFVDLGGGSGTFIDEEHHTATLNFTINNGLYGADSIIVTLRDTIRGTSKSMSFEVQAAPCMCGEYNLDDEESDNTLSVFPSVTNKIVTIESKKEITGDLTVYDISGNLVMDQKINSFTRTDLNLEGLTAGIYIIKITDGENIFTRKIVKE